MEVMTSLATPEQQVQPKEPKFPVVEIFGPTIQGEGTDQGIPCHFVRFGGCDYKCTWCDSPHAVLPKYVRRAERKTAKDIVTSVKALPTSAKWIVLSGGNPLLYDLGELITLLHQAHFTIAVETQGTRWKNWLWQVDRIAVSPKPPSSGHDTNWSELNYFLSNLDEFTAFLKVVVYHQEDYRYAKEVHRRYPRHKMFVSACNDAGATVGNPDKEDTRSNSRVALDLIDRGRRLANWVMTDPEMHDVRVQIQNHVLYWSNERGR